MVREGVLILLDLHVGSLDVRGLEGGFADQQGVDDHA